MRVLTSALAVVVIVAVLAIGFFYAAGSTVPSDSVHRYAGIPLATATPGHGKPPTGPPAWLVAGGRAVMGLALFVPACGDLCAAQLRSRKRDEARVTYRDGAPAVVVVGASRVASTSGTLQPEGGNASTGGHQRDLSLVRVADGPLTLINLPRIGAAHAHFLDVSVKFKDGSSADYYWTVQVK